MRNKRSIVLFFLLIGFVTSLFAQEDWFYGKKIKKVNYQGLKTLTSTDLDSVTNQYIGKDFSDEVYSEFLGSLFALEYFDDISTSDTIPTNIVQNGTSYIEHEATVSKVSEEQLFYLMSRGLVLQHTPLEVLSQKVQWIP